MLTILTTLISLGFLIAIVFEIVKYIETVKLPKSHEVAYTFEYFADSLTNGLTKTAKVPRSFEYVTDSKTNEIIFFINHDGTGYISMPLEEAEQRLIASGKEESIYPLRVLANCSECRTGYNKESN
jgi:hypothetical protein